MLEEGGGELEVWAGGRWRWEVRCGSCVGMRMHTEMPLGNWGSSWAQIGGHVAMERESSH